MTSVCISKCVSDARDPRVPVRATYVNLYKWPESDAEFVKSVAANMRCGMPGHPRVVDSISCRQMFLRSYTFSREEDHELNFPKKTNKCFGNYNKGIVKEKNINKKKGKVIFSNSANSNNNNVRKRRKKERRKKTDDNGGRGGCGDRDGGRKRRCLVIKKMMEVSLTALFKIFHGCLSCATSVDVVDRND